MCLVGMMVQRAIYKYKGKDSNAVLGDDLLPTSVTHTSELTPGYSTTRRTELQENVAYGPVALAT